MLHFPLCRKSALGMPRIEIEFEFDIVFCFGIRLARYAFFKMPKYVLSLQVNPKLKHLLSVLRYRLPRFRGKGQNQRVATFLRHKSID